MKPETFPSRIGVLMPIVATCPYCRAGAVRAPDSAAGANARCPKCGSNFTVVPDVGLPGWNSPAQPTAPMDETLPYATAADVTEPSPVLPPDPLLKNVAPKRAAPKPVHVADPAPPGLGIALAAFILFGLAMLATLFPYGRFSAPGVAALGLLVGLFALSAEGRTRLIAVVALLLNALVIVAVFLAPSWLGLDSWKPPAPPGGAHGPQSIGHGTGNTTTVEWVDAASASWIYGDVRVTVRSASFAPVELVGPNGATRRTKEQYLHIAIRVANDGVERKIDLSGWALGEGGIELTDLAGNGIKPKRFEGGWDFANRPKPLTGLFPGKTSDLNFVFEKPVKNEALRLSLAGAAVGVPDPIRFRLSESFLHYPKSR